MCKYFLGRRERGGEEEEREREREIWGIKK